MSKPRPYAKRTLVGYCAVDSGQIMIVDPCYVLTPMSKGEAEAKYEKCCDITLSRDRVGQVTMSGVAGDGIVTGTATGDGQYPVYATYNDHDEIMGLEIEFDTWN